MCNIMKSFKIIESNRLHVDELSTLHGGGLTCDPIELYKTATCKILMVTCGGSYVSCDDTDYQTCKLGYSGAPGPAGICNIKLD